MGRRRPSPMDALGDALPDQGERGDPEEGSGSGQARMDQRTRTQLPLLPALLRAVEQHRKDAEERVATATAMPAGSRFTAGGEEFQRCRQGESGRIYAVGLATGQRRDLTHEESAAFWSWATVEVLRHTGIRIEEMLELTHHSFVAYTLPTTGEVVPMLQVAPSKTDAERLLLVSPELGEVLTAIIFRVRAGNAALPLVAAYDVFEQTWSPPMPFLFQRRFGTEDRPLTRSYVRECLVATSQAAQITAADQPLEWRPHDFRRIFVTDAIRSGLPPHIAAKVCGHSTVDTTMGYAAIYPEDVIAHHRAFIARRRAERPSEEYRDLTSQEWDAFLAHFELRKVALGMCGRDHGTPCAHENACVRCPLLRVDPAQCLGWRRSTPISSIGWPRPRSRAGSARSPRSKPHWPPPSRNLSPCDRRQPSTPPLPWGCPVAGRPSEGRVPTADSQSRSYFRSCR